MEEEGWYVDPYRVHEARWISAGRPTALVRDGDVESQDPPPDTHYEGELEELPAKPPGGGGDDFLRADDAENESFDPDREEEAVWDVFDESSGGD